MGFLDFLRSIICPKQKPPVGVIYLPGLDIPPELLRRYPRVNPVTVLGEYGYKDVVVADAKYIALPKVEWEDILEDIYDTLNPMLEYQVNVWDCDNYSTIFASILALTFYTNYSTAKYQLAFGICWSESHAYNCFIDSDKKVWIYEPQTNEIIGEITKVKNKTYKPIKIWFMG